MPYKKGKGISRNRCPLISSPLKFYYWLVETKKSTSAGDHEKFITTSRGCFMILQVS